MRQKMLLLAAVFFGVLAFMFTYHQLSLERQKIQGSVVDRVVIQAVKDIGEGDKITEDNVKLIKVKRSVSALAASREIPGDNKNSIIDRQVRFLVRAGEILNWSDIKMDVGSGRGGLSNLIKPGNRAISISVDSTSSVNCLIQPQNHVDIIGTFRFPDLKGDSAYDTITMTILQNVVILATGSDMGINEDPRRNGFTRSYATVTLALTPKEVEMIIFASQKGRLQLSLRNYEETSIEKQVQSVNWKYLQDNISKYTLEREQDMKFRARGGK